MGTSAAADGLAGTRQAADGPGAATPWPLRPGVVITLATVLGLGLRAFQLSRPGYLSGFTQYDDGVYIGNALRLVNGVIPYRDFAMVQPPGSMLLMVPAALLGKAFGSMWALGAARVLTAGADTANVALIGLLVRHRGPLAAGLASGGYAIYPPALTASQARGSRPQPPPPASRRPSGGVPGAAVGVQRVGGRAVLTRPVFVQLIQGTSPVELLIPARAPPGIECDPAA